MEKNKKIIWGIVTVVAIVAIIVIANVIIASVLGVASPLCMYGTIPIAASFSKNGMEDDWLQLL